MLYTKNTTMKKLKFAFLAVLIMVPVATHAPEPEDRNLAGLTSSEYIKVYATDGVFDDKFHIYIYGNAERRKAHNPRGYSVPYNEISYMKLDNRDRILDIKTAEEL